MAINVEKILLFNLALARGNYLIASQSGGVETAGHASCALEAPIRQQLMGFFALFDGVCEPIDKKFVSECEARCASLAKALDIDLVLDEQMQQSTDLVPHMSLVLGNICKHFQFKKEGWNFKENLKGHEVMKQQLSELWTIISRLK